MHIKRGVITAVVTSSLDIQSICKFTIVDLHHIVSGHHVM